MSTLSSIVNLVIKRATAILSQQDLSTPLVAAYHTRFPERARVYTSLAGMEKDGFVETDAAHQIVAEMFSQTPRPRRVIVGRRALPPTQIMRLTPTDPESATGVAYSLEIDGEVCPFTTATSYATLAAVCTGLATAINATTPSLDVTADGTSGTHVECTADVLGALHSFDALTSTLALEDRTLDPGIATDLSAIRAARQDWFGLLLDSQGRAEALAAGAWAEANLLNQGLLGVQTGDSAVVDVAPAAGTTGDVANTLHNFSRLLTFCVYQPRIGAQWPAAAWMARKLTVDRGQKNDTWWGVPNLPGITATALSDTQRSNLWGDGRTTFGKCCNAFIDVAGSTCPMPGKVAGNEWIDVIVFLSWLFAKISQDFAGLLFSYAARDEALPFTQKGIDVSRGTVQSSLNAGVRAGGLSDDPDHLPVVTAPTIDEVSDADRAARRLPGVEFTARISGAIQAVDITGTVS